MMVMMLNDVADAGGDFMQVVVSDISNVAVEFLNLAVLLFPVLSAL